MDGDAFDALVKRLTQARLSRLDAVRGVLATAVVGLTGAARTDDTDAKRKRKEARKKGGKGKQSGHARHQKLQRQGPAKVTLCHKGQTIEVPPSAVQAHLGHGDTLGACGAPTPGLEACAGIVDGSDPSGQCSHCCQGVCCQLPANQCNLAGLCCAPNCANRECGSDGCGRGGTCGCGAGGTCTRGAVCPAGQVCTCPSGRDCNPVSGQCPGPPATTTSTTTSTTTTTSTSTTTTTALPCLQRCPVGEACTGGQCACGKFGASVAPNTCCPARSPGGDDHSVCNVAGESSQFLVADTCDTVTVAEGCPEGYTTCIGPTNAGCQTCCPPGTTCDPQGFCRQATCCPPAGQTCRHGGCFLVCDSDAPCRACGGAGCRCDEAEGFCLDTATFIAVCSSDADCPLGTICSLLVNGAGQRLCVRSCPGCTTA